MIVREKMTERRLPTLQPIPLFYPQAQDPIAFLIMLPFYLMMLPFQMLQMIPAPPIAGLPRVAGSYENVETYEWVDRRGKPRKLVVKRKAVKR